MNTSLVLIVMKGTHYLVLILPQLRHLCSVSANEFSYCCAILSATTRLWISIYFNSCWLQPIFCCALLFLRMVQVRWVSQG